MLYAKHRFRNGDIIEVSYELRDRERWVVWCHGAGSSKDNARADAVNELAGSLGVSFVALDARGGDGQSTKLEEPTFEHWIQDVRLVSRSGPRRYAPHVVLMGHSRGGLAGAWVAALNEKQSSVKGVVMISAAFGHAERREQEIGVAGLEAVLRQGKFEYEKWGSLHMLTRKQFLAEQHYTDALLAGLWRTLPLLVIHGDQDKTVPVEYAHAFIKEMGKHRRKADSIILPGVDHRFKGREVEVLAYARPFLERVFK
ncbi:MAG: alpha/beta fold hydrolase [Candidatus Wildermuthbacteria bacterium]|nr:alpha/beta fold hydrolase [Candidatus Wildermuthbacteria bacterium]